MLFRNPARMRLGLFTDPNIDFGCRATLDREASTIALVLYCQASFDCMANDY